MRESKIKTTGKASLNYEGKDYELPVLSGSQGPNAVDIRKLYDQADIFTYDPGFTSTASTESNITFIDGDKGVLQYRGYAIADLAEHSSFLESCFLLLNGELPNRSEMEKFEYTISHHTMVHEQLATFYRGFRRDAHPMAVMCGVVGALSAFYHDFDRHHRSAPARDRELSPDRQDAHHRRDGLQVSCRPALRVSEQRSGLHGEFPAHVLLGSRRGVQGQ